MYSLPAQEACVADIPAECEKARQVLLDYGMRSE